MRLSTIESFLYTLSSQLVNCLEGLGGVALLEKVCIWRKTLMSQRPMTGPVLLSQPAAGRSGCNILSSSTMCVSFPPG